jgi:hypothetical protein
VPWEVAAVTVFLTRAAQQRPSLSLSQSFGAATITPTSMVWSRVEGVGGAASPARYGHSATSVQLKDGRVVTVVFGGVLAGERDNAVLVFDHGEDCIGCPVVPPTIASFHSSHRLSWCHWCAGACFPHLSSMGSQCRHLPPSDANSWIPGETKGPTPRARCCTLVGCPATPSHTLAPHAVGLVATGLVLLSGVCRLLRTHGHTGASACLFLQFMQLFLWAPRCSFMAARLRKSWLLRPGRGPNSGSLDQKGLTTVTSGRGTHPPVCV